MPDAGASRKRQIQVVPRSFGDVAASRRSLSHESGALRRGSAGYARKPLLIATRGADGIVLHFDHDQHDARMIVGMESAGLMARFDAGGRVATESLQHAAFTS